MPAFLESGARQHAEEVISSTLLIVNCISLFVIGGVVAYLCLIRSYEVAATASICLVGATANLSQQLSKRK